MMLYFRHVYRVPIMPTPVSRPIEPSSYSKLEIDDVLRDIKANSLSNITTIAYSKPEVDSMIDDIKSSVSTKVGRADVENIVQTNKPIETYTKSQIDDLLKSVCQTNTDVANDIRQTIREMSYTKTDIDAMINELRANTLPQPVAPTPGVVVLGRPDDQMLAIESLKKDVDSLLNVSVRMF